MRYIGGRHYFSPHEVAEKLGVDRRTVLRWTSTGEKGRIGDIEVWQDPLNGYYYFEEESVLKLLELARPVPLSRLGVRNGKLKKLKWSPPNPEPQESDLLTRIDEMHREVARMAELEKQWRSMRKELERRLGDLRFLYAPERQREDDEGPQVSEPTPAG